jgi:hypothetical protein
MSILDEFGELQQKSVLVSSTLNTKEELTPRRQERQAC